MKQFYKQGWALVALAAIILSSFIVASILPGEKAFATNEFYTLYYKKDDVKSIQLGIGTSTAGSTGATGSNLYKTAVYARGGVFGDQVRFDYSNNIANGFVYKYSTTCNYSAKNTYGGSSPSSLNITWSIVVPLDSNFDSHSGYKSSILPIEMSNPQLAGTGVDTNSYSQLPAEAKSTCFPHGATTTPGPTVKNYNNLSTIEKHAWTNLKTSEESGVGLTGAAIGATAPADSTPTGTNCQGGAMGWLFCPMINYMADVIRITAGLIDNMMQVTFLSQTGAGAQIETAWRAFLSIANILLVVAFLIIIFSQSTGSGLSNYGIKRMLPRLIIAAILMNISFYICALAIDISNITGASIMGFLVGKGNSVASSIGAVTGQTDGGFLDTLGSAAAITVGVIALFFFLLVPVVLSIIVIFISLIGRQVILMCLVLVSPLAFVAWLLPNTEQYFKKWMNMFMQLLILYPAVMLMFGASLYLSNLLGSDAGKGVIPTP